jgi:serine/threonine-protein kinase
MDIEHDLAFGLTAVRFGYVDFNQYATATTLWAQGKHQSLADVMTDICKLTPSQRVEIESLAKSTRGSLQNVTLDCGENNKTKMSSPPLRENQPVPTLQEDQQKDQKPFTSDATLAHDPNATLAGFLSDIPTVLETRQGSSNDLPKGDPRPQDPGATLDCSQTQQDPNPRNGFDKQIPTTGDRANRERYRFTKILGEGGLGRVWQATDCDLNRDVALKEIQPHLAESQVKIRRFMLEAQVTGQLEHPNIVPVYELSRRPQDGQPFYTMRYVRGKTLSQSISEFHVARRARHLDRLELSRLLSQFYGVCYAIGYAHSRGVIHRDLKPDNVVLGDFGEVNLLDWGLARLVARPAASEESSIHLSPEAASGSEVRGGIEGTPAYMAPEQVDEKFGEIGTHSDIYGLGAILFEILTDVPPHRGGNLMSLLDDIVAKDTPLPRQLEPSVPRALEAICAKAMAKNPKDRYANATDLALDLQRFITDEPVSVFVEPIFQRLMRWARRHRAWTQAVASALILVTGVSIVAAFLINGAKQKEEAARKDAQSRYSQARGFVDTLLTGVSQRLANVPGVASFRKQLLAEASVAYREFAAERSNDPDLQKKSGEAHLRLAEVLRIQEEYEPAIVECQEAEAVFTTQLRSNPSNSEIARLRAQSLATLGRVESSALRIEKASEHYRQAMKMFDDMAKDRPHDEPLLIARAECASRYALVLHEEDKIEDSKRNYRAALDDYNHLISDNQGKGLESLLSRRATTFMNLAALLDKESASFLAKSQAESAISDKKEAIKNTRAAIKDLEILVQNDSDVPEYFDLLATAKNNLGQWLKDQDEDVEAIKNLSESVETYEILVNKTTVSEHLFGLVIVRTKLATIITDREESQTKDLQKALELLRDAVSSSRTLVKLYPKVAYKIEQAEAYYSQAMLQRRLELKKDAVDSFNEAVRIWTEIIAVDNRDSVKSTTVNPLQRLGMTRFWRGYTLLQINELELAIADIESLDTLPTRDASDHYNAACCWSLASALTDDKQKKADFQTRSVSQLRQGIEKDAKLLAPRILEADPAKQDPDLGPIRNTESFRKLRDSLKK